MGSGVMTIRINLLTAAAARSAQQFLGQINQLKSGMQGGAASWSSFTQNINNSALIKAGKNMQWVGRQLLYNITLPLAGAGTAAFKMAQDNERAFVSLRKVYGDLSMSTKQVTEETDALKKSFELLSDVYGVNQAEVIKVGAAWAQAGSAGVGLAQNTKATLEAAVLGDMDLGKATEALISIQATWGLSTVARTGELSDLQKALADMNVIENQTGIDMEGLIDVLTRAGGVARAGGGDIRHLAAMAAALVPATGGAAQAGNALRTIMSRLAAPTTQTAAILEKMGINVASKEWLGKNIDDKITTMADSFNGLSEAQKLFVAGTIASRWQINKFDVLMTDLANTQGYYKKSLEATNDPQRAFLVYQKELQAVLQSNPKRFEIFTNIMKNALTDAFIPMLPSIIQLVKFIAQLGVAFNNLSPNVKQAIIMFAGLMAIVGPMLMMMSAIAQMLGVFGAGAMAVVGKLGETINFAIGFIWQLGTVASTVLTTTASLSLKLVATVAKGVSSMLTTVAEGLLSVLGGVAAAVGLPVWAVVAIIAAVVAAIVLLLNKNFRDAVWDMIKSIGNAFAQLPRIVGMALQAVVNTIGNFIGAIVDGLSYLNPFARHSPSLVDNVRAGVATILDEYSKLKQVPAMVSTAFESMQNFNQTTAPAMGGFFGQQMADLRDRVAKQGGPGAGGAADAVIANIIALKNHLPALTAEIDQQQMATAAAQQAADKANQTYDDQKKILDGLQDSYDALGSQIDAAKQKINDLADTGITGMHDFDQAIFENTQGINQAKLQLLQFEAAGQKLDDMKQRMADLNGEIDTLQGRRSDLRLKGAGSDILGIYDAQISAAEQQKATIEQSSKAMQSLQDQIDNLDLKNQILELQKSVTFDPLLRQIDQLANGVKELPFDQIVAQIREQQTLVAQLQPQYDAIGAQLDQQKASVDAANAARDAANAQLDVQQRKLDGLNNAFSDMQGLIRDMTSALEDFASAGEDAAAKVEKAAKAAADAKAGKDSADLFGAAAGVDFPIAGGNKVLGPEGGLPEIQAFNADLQKQLEDLLGGMKFDLTKPLKDAWNQIQTWFHKADNWVKGTLFASGRWIADNWAKPFVWLGQQFMNLIGTPIADAFSRAWESINQWGSNVGGFFTDLWSQYIFPPLDLIYQYVIGPFVEGFTTGFGAVETIIGGVQTVITDGSVIIIAAFKAIYDFIDTYIVPIFQAMAVIMLVPFALVANGIWQAWDKLIHPAFSAIYDWLSGPLTKIFKTFQTVAENVWDAIKSAIQTAWNTIRPTWDNLLAAIGVIRDTFNALSRTVQTVWGDISGFVWNAWVGINGIFVAIIDAIYGPVSTAFSWLRDQIIKPVFNAIAGFVARAMNGVVEAIESGVNLGIHAFNALANGINAVADFLHIPIKVSTIPDVHLPRVGIPQLATGGVVGAAGDKVLGARAIVGEGSNMYPEYVIPTDPKYRNNAERLLRELDIDLGSSRRTHSGMSYESQKLAALESKGFIGGWGPVGWAVDAGKSAVSAATDAIAAAGGFLREKAVEAAFAPAEAAVNTAMGAIPIPFVKDTVKALLDNIKDFLSGAETEFEAQAKKFQVQANPGQGAGSWRVIPPYLDSVGVPYKQLSTFRAGDLTESGTPSYHSMDRAIDIGGPRGLAVDPPALLAIDKAVYAGFLPYLKELIYGGPGHQTAYNGVPHEFSPTLQSHHLNHVHAALANGGSVVIGRRPGGTHLLVGEGNHDERVQVTPLRGKQGDGGDTYNFYGDIVLPNVNDRSSADDLLRNLKAVMNG
jgi:TP901 family phage tail tape measure protein